jgi:hypothetical protein
VLEKERIDRKEDVMRLRIVVFVLAALFSLPGGIQAQPLGPTKDARPAIRDNRPTGEEHAAAETTSAGRFGVEIMLSMDGYGAGVFYRHQYTPDLSGFVSFSVSEAKDEKEFEMYDPFYQISYTPGKLKRFMVLPLMAGIEYRLFREDIVDTFRPYLTAGAGPTMIYVMPYVNILYDSSGAPQSLEQIEFFKSIGRGSPRYTASAFVGFGAHFGSDKGPPMGVNFRYYFTYLFGDPIPSMFNSQTLQVVGTKNSFGGFFIILSIGFGS